MSLVVWLPLNGNLENQGLSNMTFSYIQNNGALSVNNSGKIGKCYERTASAKNDLIRSSTTINLSDDISMACWAYVTGTIGDTANGLITNHSHADNTGIGITVKQVSTGDYRISCNTGTGSSRTYCTYYGKTNIKNAWHHLVLTYNKTAKQLQLWVDGKVECTLNNYVNASKADYIDIFNWSTTHYANGDYRPTCKLNDVRVYDHCLSVKEVGELAKGLVLHYRLAGPGRPNLLSYQKIVKQENVSLSYDPNTLIFTTKTPTSSTYYGVRMATDKCIIPWNHIGILSMEIYSPVAASFVRDDNDYAINGNSWSGNDNTSRGNITSMSIPANKWTKIAIYSINNSSQNTNKESVKVQSSFNISAANTEFKFKNVKFEVSAISTDRNVIPWCPASDDILYSTLGYNNNIEYDCSGYRRNGTKSGNITWDIDSPRYTMSYNYTDSETSIKLGDLSTIIPEGIFTFNIWFKKETNKWSSKAYETILGGPGGFELETKNSASNSPIIFAYSWGKGAINYTLDTWHMLTMVRTSVDTKFYLDGELKLTGSAGTIPAGNYFIGAWRSALEQNYRGLLADARIYVTELSAEDIAELYHSAVIVDNTGKTYAYEYFEA